MRLSKFGLAAVMAAGFVFAGGGGTAVATCYSSTAANQAFTDATNDAGAGLAPEILGAVALTDSACSIGIGPAIANTEENELIAGESVLVYLNTDGSSATGTPTFGGADKVVITLGQTGADLLPVLGTWTGSSFNFAGAPSLTPVDAAGFVSTLDQLGIATPGTLGIKVASLYEGIYNNYADFAPEPGAPLFQFPVAFSTTAPPVTPPTTPPVTPPTTPPVTTPTPTAPSSVVPDAVPEGCTVPKLKGRSVLKAVAALVKAGCKYKIVKVRSKKKAGTIVSVNYAAKTVTSKRVVVKVSRGPGVKKASNAAAATYAAIERHVRDAAE